MSMIPWFQWTTVHIGPIPIQVWGFFVAVGMMAALTIIWKRSRRYGLNEDAMADLAFWIILSGFFFARLFHVALYEPAFYAAHPEEIIKIWHGGVSSFGGGIGAIVAFFIFVKKRRIPKSDWIRIADLLSFSALFGWIIGRIGCFMIHDHLGAHSNCPLAMKTPDGPRFDMALLEILGLLPLAVYFFWIKNKKKREGFFTSLLFIYYGVLRFFLDFLRATDIPNADVRYAGLTPAQYGCIILVAFGVWIIRRKDRIVAE